MNMSQADADTMIEQIKPLPHQHVFFTGIHYDTPYDFFSRESVVIKNTNALLVCGIARPEPLLAFLKDNTADVHTLSYKDHHYFVSADLEEIKTAYNNWDKQQKIIVTTEKDAARLQLHYEKLREWNIPIIVIPIAVTVLFNKGYDFDNIVLQYVEIDIAENNEIFGGPTEEY
jgi:tetraacyldisaccharide 4'-kinase